MSIFSRAGAFIKKGVGKLAKKAAVAAATETRQQADAVMSRATEQATTLVGDVAQKIANDKRVQEALDKLGAAAAAPVQRKVRPQIIMAAVAVVVVVVIIVVAARRN